MRRLNDLLAFEIGVSRLILVGALVGTLLLAGCASADPPTMSKNGCTVDLRKVCQYILDNNWLVSSSDGVTLDKQRMQNMSVRHVEVYANSFSGARLRCMIDSQTARVTDASISTASGPAPTDADVTWAYQRRLCQ